jgi:hypothetical protein
MKDVGKFYEHFVYFTSIWYILWPFGIFWGHFGIFFPVLVYCSKKNLTTLVKQTKNVFCYFLDPLVPKLLCNGTCQIIFFR